MKHLVFLDVLKCLIYVQNRGSKKTFCKYLLLKFIRNVVLVWEVGQTTFLNSMHCVCLCRGSRSGGGEGNAKIDFMEPIKTLGKIGLVPWLQGSQKPYQVSKEGHFLAGAETSGYLGELESREIHLNLYLLQAKSDDKSLAWLLIFKSLLKVQVKILYEKFQQTKSTRACMVNCSSFCTYVDNQAKFIEMT